MRRAKAFTVYFPFPLSLFFLAFLYFFLCRLSLPVSDHFPFVSLTVLFFCDMFNFVCFFPKFFSFPFRFVCCPLHSVRKKSCYAQFLSFSFLSYFFWFDSFRFFSKFSASIRQQSKFIFNWPCFSFFKIFLSFYCSLSFFFFSPPFSPFTQYQK